MRLLELTKYYSIDSVVLVSVGGMYGRENSLYLIRCVAV